MSTRGARPFRGSRRISNVTGARKVMQPGIYRFLAESFKLFCSFGRRAGSLINSRGKAEGGGYLYSLLVNSA